MEKKLVSIIVPVYKVEEYLDECMQSLINQTYQNLEILLIDDGSPDRCPEICDEWAKRDSRIKVIHTENHGVSHARNVGLDKASGEYIGFVDADDWVDPDYYEKMVTELLRTGADVCGVGYTRETSNGPQNILHKGEACVYSREKILCEIFSRVVPKLLWWELCDKLFCRKLVTTNRLNEHIFNAEDKLFFWQAMKEAKKFAYLPTYGYHYRMREDSATHSKITEKSLSFKYADDKIFADAKQEQEPLRSLLWEQHVIAMIAYARDGLVFMPDAHRIEIEQIQKFLRKNFFRIQRMQLSFWQRIGIFYLLLPFSCCKLLRSLATWRYNKSKSSD